FARLIDHRAGDDSVPPYPHFDIDDPLSSFDVDSLGAPFRTPLRIRCIDVAPLCDDEKQGTVVQAARHELSGAVRHQARSRHAARLTLSWNGYGGAAEECDDRTRDRSSIGGVTHA